ncbi:MAG TPA: hypothetical protein VIS05_03770 [Ilumatobacter sp.]
MEPATGHPAPGPEAPGGRADRNDTVATRVTAAAVAVGLAMIVGARWWALGAPGGRALAGGAVAVAVPTAAIAWCHHRGRPVAAAALALACSATALAAASDGRWQGVLALVVAAGVVAAAFGGRPARAGFAALAAVALALWWRSGLDEPGAPGPAWTAIAGDTGHVVRRAVSSVGLDELRIPPSGEMAWWLGVGVVAAVALLDGSRLRALWVPLGLATLVGGIWTIGLLRGPVAPLGGTWVLAAAIMLAAVGPVAGPVVGRRLAAAVALLGTATWAVAFVRELRDHRVAAAVVAACGALVVTLALLGPWFATAPAGRPRPATDQPVRSPHG